jgi:aspartate-semialdehyde dehydrogenase
MDVGCFDPFETLYQQEVHKFMSDSIGRSAIRYDVCALVCKVNENALSPSNLRSSFKDIMFPIDPNVINPNCTVPSLVYTGKALLENSTTSTDKHVEGGNKQLHSNNI